MRFFAAFLLLLAMPGLLLPAGFLLRICRCDATPKSEQRSCCSAATATAAAPTRSCCQHRQDRDEAPPDRTPRAHANQCGCVWLHVPDDRHDPTLPDGASPMLGSTPTTCTLPVAPTWSTPNACIAAPWVESRPPPPGTNRNLPLRL